MYTFLPPEWFVISPLDGKKTNLHLIEADCRGYGYEFNGSECNNNFLSIFLQRKIFSRRLFSLGSVKIFFFRRRAPLPPSVQYFVFVHSLPQRSRPPPISAVAIRSGVGERPTFLRLLSAPAAGRHGDKGMGR